MAVVDRQSEMTKTTKIAQHEADRCVNNLNESVATRAKVGCKSKMAEASDGADGTVADDDDGNRCVFFLSDNDEYENTCDDTLEGIKTLKKGAMSDFEDFDPEEDRMTCSSASREGKEAKVSDAGPFGKLSQHPAEKGS